MVEEQQIAKEKVVEARQVEEQQRKTITTKCHQLAKERVVVCCKAILEAKAEAIGGSPVKEKGFAKGERVTCDQCVVWGFW